MERWIVVMGARVLPGARAAGGAPPWLWALTREVAGLPWDIVLAAWHRARRGTPPS